VAPDGAKVADDLSGQLAAHIVRTRFDDIPAAAVAVTKRSIVDALGVMLAASGLGEGCTAFAELARETNDTGPSAVWGFGFGSAPLMAAFANGAMAHAMDFEDTHDATLVHPHAACVPAAIAVAQSLGGVSGKDLITAVALGADLNCRLALGLEDNPDHYGWFMMPMLGTYGATAAVAKLMGLNESQIVQAFSLAFCQAVVSGELKHDPASHLRAVRDGFSAKAGVTGASLAARGVRGFSHPFEGEAGFYAQYAGGRYNRAAILDGLGRHFETVNLSYKPWPSCRGTHSFVEAALKLMRSDGISAEAIESAHTTVSPFFANLCSPLAQKAHPETAIDAKFSIPFTTAAALCHGTIEFGHYSPEALSDPAVTALADRFTHTIQEDWTREKSTYGRLEIRTKDGATHACLIETPLGHPANPITNEALAAKFMDCAANARVPLDPARVDAIAGAVETLQDAADIGEVFG
jgi:2-methylcitrate dehydratase PrpD